MKTRHAFTLVELLVVIGIIAIVAALVVNMNALAQAKKRNTAVNADKQKLLNMIDTYQSKLNFYPPDNAALASYSPANYSANFALYDALAATNPLIYELTGATNNYQGIVGNILVFDGTTQSSGTFSNLFGRSAVANASTDEPKSFFQPGPQTKEYTIYTNSTLSGLLVPVPVSNDPNVNNFWHYDASSPNRHNLGSYDLWAEYITGSQNGSPLITTNGNW